MKGEEEVGEESEGRRRERRGEVAGGADAASCADSKTNILSEGDEQVQPFVGCGVQTVLVPGISLSFSLSRDFIRTTRVSSLRAPKAPWPEIRSVSITGGRGGALGDV